MTDVIWEFSEGRVASGENECIIRRIDGTPKPPLVFCHQHQTRTEAILQADYYRDLFLALAEDYTICVADLGYTTGYDRWGDDLNQTRIGQAKTLLNDIGATGDITLVSASHGNVGAMNYAKNNPTLVTALAAITPAMSLNSIKQVSGGQYADDINARYGGNYTDAAYGNSYSPHYYRAAYPASQVPTAIWTAPNDAIVLNQWVDDFVEAHVVNGRSRIRRYDLGGGLGHGEAALAAAVPGVVDWLRGNRDKD